MRMLIDYKHINVIVVWIVVRCIQTLQYSKKNLYFCKKHYTVCCDKSIKDKLLFVEINKIFI